MIKEAGADQGDAGPQIIVVQHFDEELKRLSTGRITDWAENVNPGLVLGQPLV